MFSTTPSNTPSTLGRILALAALITGTTLTAVAAPPVTAAGSAPTVFKRAELKIQPRTTTTPPLSAADAAKVRTLLAQRRAEFGKDRDARKFLSGGGASLNGPAAVAYQMGAAALATGPSGSRFVKTGSQARPSAIPPTYTIEAGAVTGATSAGGCDGTLDLSFTIKNRGTKPADGVSPNLYVDLSRETNWQGAHSTAWVTVPSLAAGATATVQINGLRHLRPNANGQGTCPSGEITVIPSFVGVVTGAEYRLKINLTVGGAEATLLVGPFMSESVGSSAGGSGGGSGGFGITWPDGLKPPGQAGGDCGALLRCSSGACALACPPCPAGYSECNGYCDIVPCP